MLLQTIDSIRGKQPQWNENILQKDMAWAVQLSKLLKPPVGLYAVGLVVLLVMYMLTENSITRI